MKQHEYGTFTNTGATLRLVDRADQGVCPQGHQCFLNSTGGPATRFTRGCVAGEYEGLPLVANHVTGADIDYAEHLGADRDIVEWARLTIADRAPLHRHSYGPAARPQFYEHSHEKPDGPLV